MDIKLYNSFTRQLEPFIPLNPQLVGMYACGPTVYNYAHIGNLRAYLFEDILRRSLEFFGYKTQHVMNITDVGHLTDDGDAGEDKMIKGAREKGMSVWDIAEFFTQAFFKDAEKINILKPHITCRATEHIREMIDLIKRLEEKGFTYQAGGNIYFDISKFPDYGKMALLDRQELKAGARTALDQNKHNPHDFVLWFTNSKFEHQAMLWDSPWGKGYPGWHIECSAMSMKYLGEQFDIHCGGIDHIPVHHTNEIAQSEAATGKKWVNYWLHNEYLINGSGKMAKSSGGFLTLDRLKELGWEPLDYRYFCLGALYRSQLLFSADSLNSAKAARNGINERVLRLKLESKEQPADLSSAGEEYLEQFSSHLAQDLNTPRALAVLWAVLKDKRLKSGEKLALVYEMDRVLGLGLKELAEETVELESEFLQLINERDAARKNKDFAKADLIRDQLRKAGILIEDSPQGTRWKKA